MSDNLMSIERVLIEVFDWKLRYDLPKGRARVLPDRAVPKFISQGLIGGLEADIYQAQEILKARRLEKLELTLKQAQRKRP